MFNKTTVSLLVLAAATGVNARIHSPRELSYQNYFRFSPETQVTDHAAIDLDQQEIVNYLAADTPEWGNAQSVYENGAHSKTYAVLSLTDGLPISAAKGQAVTGSNEAGNGDASGKVYSDANMNALSLEVQYLTSDDSANYVGCQAGASADPVTEGCFAESGKVNLAGTDVAYNGVVNKNGRSIKGFSTNEDKHRVNGSGDFYKDFDMAKTYYGTTSYADEWVMAALAGTSTSFPNGNANWRASADEARVEGVKKGTAYMSVFMYVIRELEDSLDDCEKGCDTDECNDDAVHALDEAVAFYTGSLPIDIGVMLYGLAEKRCKNFNTCGTDSFSNVNAEIFTNFNRMQDNLLKEKCDIARDNKDRIAELMYVPMIQGTLRYAYFSGERDDQTEKSEAEGATFAAAVLPKLHSCNEKDAKTVYDNMKIGNTSPADFSAVKRAFEKNYGCMGISCADVGGLHDGENYFDNAAPCGGSFALNMGLALGMAMGTVLALL